MQTKASKKKGIWYFGGVTVSLRLLYKCTPYLCFILTTGSDALTVHNQTAALMCVRNAEKKTVNGLSKVKGYPDLI